MLTLILMLASLVRTGHKDTEGGSNYRPVSA